MASRSMRESYQQAKPRKGSMPVFGNDESTWSAFSDGRELLARPLRRGARLPARPVGGPGRA